MRNSHEPGRGIHCLLIQIRMNKIVQAPSRCRFIEHIADLSARIRINRRTSPSPSVGASGVGLGAVGPCGRPRPVPLAHILVEADPIPTHGRASRPSQPLIIRPRPSGSSGPLPGFLAELDASYCRFIGPAWMFEYPD